MEATKAKIRTFLTRFFRKRELRDDEDMFALGFINSLFAMQLVMFLESEFSIELNNDDLDLENLKSINAIAELIEKKQSQLSILSEAQVETTYDT
ncbi:acyl carrier protein [Brevibacillus antibioticus]|uniref:Acyl carrier protein n=1 Tax=Brevibacillus antibioticus TaxID=2570228 RepID=A0A4U2Y3K8_9BACL|nr:acyl carrier protein [Brevibacillus antibioticus]TKI55060.1 acyl carrier protein [Brevibacillus antibioticus]